MLTFHSGITEKELIRRAAEEGIKVYGLSDYVIGEMQQGATVLLGYANLSEEEIRESVKILCRIWSA